VSGLPTFEQMRVAARRLLSDARDELKSDWQRGSGPTPAQNQARLDALHHIGLAKAALDQAGRP
jgi:hypothetical protein